MSVHDFETSTATGHAGKRLHRTGAHLLIAIALTACGGGEATAPMPGAVSIPAAPPALEPLPAVSLGASLSSVKLLTLSWTSTNPAFAQRAVVLEDPDGDGPLPAEALAEVPAADGKATVELFLPIALYASYRVSLCNDSQCVQSEPVRLQGSLEQGMGRFKADMPLRFAEFGISLALSRDGGIMAVGDISGAVHLFQRNGPGLWASLGPLPVPDPAPGRLFNRALALSADGSVLAFGARGVNGAGAAYVYRRQGTQWLFERHLQGTEVSDDDEFGHGLALSGDGRTLAVGAHWDDGPGDTSRNDGAVYVFSESDGSWTQTQLLRDGNSATDERFGSSLALTDDGSTLAVGSPYNQASGLGVHDAPVDNADAPGTGAAYVYKRRQPGGWFLEAFIKPPMDLGTGAFGSAVALDADDHTLVVSAREADLDPSGSVDQVNFSYSGSVHVFARAAGGAWAVHGLPLRGPVPHEDDEFGLSLALSADGQTLVVGTQYNDHSGLGVSTGESPVLASDAGSGYVFQRHAGGWGPATVLQPSDHSVAGQGGIRLGSAVAISGNGRTVAVGARSHAGPGSGVSGDPAVAYGEDAAFGLSGAVFLY